MRKTLGSMSMATAMTWKRMSTHAAFHRKVVKPDAGEVAAACSISQHSNLISNPVKQWTCCRLGHDDMKTPGKGRMKSAATTKSIENITI